MIPPLNNKTAEQLQLEQIGTLLREFKLIPEDHVIDEKILFGIIDRDRDEEFSFHDFVNNFPKYDTDEVYQFVEEESKKIARHSITRQFEKNEDDSDPFDGESSVSLSSMDSEQERKDRDFFKIMQELKRAVIKSGQVD